MVLYTLEQRLEYVMVRYTTLEQGVILYDTYVKYGSARKCRGKFRDERAPSRQTSHNLVNNLEQRDS
jgi:hypothetical protein